ncbi:hypothetical protein StoSoilB13_17440 [Arthrobacter sp. StoSoilB13]|nr:hypothetical protein StoSoilB13_17440 [Arthrobacter sp. StoSoilB13]
MNLLGVVATLGGNNNRQLGKRLNIERVLELASPVSKGRGGTSCVRGGEKYRVDVGEVVLVLHALHQDGADHATPTDQSNGRISCCSHLPSLNFCGEEPLLVTSRTQRTTPELAPSGRQADRRG